MRIVLLFLTVIAGAFGGAMFWISDAKDNELAEVQDVVSGRMADNMAGSLGGRDAAKTATVNVDGHHPSRTLAVSQAVAQAPSDATEQLEKRFFGAGLARGSAGASVGATPAPAATVEGTAKPDAWQTDVVLAPRTQSHSGSTSVLMTTGSIPAPRDIPRHALVRDIQRELKRVGCYGGDATGEWNMASKRAMQAFLERANSTLPTGDPDLIQLTLVRGYSGAACRPADASITTARAQSPRGDQARSETQRGEPTRTSQNPSQTAPVAIRALQQQQTVPQAAPAANLAASAQSQSQNQPQNQSLAQQHPTSSSGQPPVVVFEGRMAIGGPRTPEGPDTSSSPPITSSAPVVPLPARIARPRPPQQSASAAAQRPRRERAWTGNFFNQ